MLGFQIANNPRAQRERPSHHGNQCESVIHLRQSHNHLNHPHPTTPRSPRPPVPNFSSPPQKPLPNQMLPIKNPKPRPGKAMRQHIIPQRVHRPGQRAPRLLMVIGVPRPQRHPARAAHLERAPRDDRVPQFVDARRQVAGRGAEQGGQGGQRCAGQGEGDVRAAVRGAPDDCGVVAGEGGRADGEGERSG